MKKGWKGALIGGIFGAILYILIILPMLLIRINEPSQYDLMHLFETNALEILITIIIFSIVGYFCQKKINVIIKGAIIGGGIGFIIPTFAENLKIYFLAQPIKSFLLLFYKSIGIEQALLIWLASVLLYSIIGAIIGFIYTLFKKNNKILSLFFLFFIFFLSINLVSAQNEDINITVQSSSVVREGTETIIGLSILNLKDSQTIKLNKIILLDSSGNIIQNKEILKELKPLKIEVEEYNRLKAIYENNCTNEEIEKLKNLTDTINRERFVEFYDIDLRSFDKNLELLDNVEVIFQLDFLINNEEIKETRIINLTYSEPLPNNVPPSEKISNVQFVSGKDEAILINQTTRNEVGKIGKMSALPSKPSGWYAGDQHVHSS